MFLYLSVILFTGGKCISPMGRHLPRQTSPTADTHPLGRHPPEQTPPWIDTTLGRHPRADTPHLSPGRWTQNFVSTALVKISLQQYNF